MSTATSEQASPTGTKSRLHEDAGYEAITGLARDAIVTSDRAGCIVGWNRVADCLFGYKEAEVLGRPVIDLFAPRCHAAFRAQPVRVHESGSRPPMPRVAELTGRRRDGSEFQLEITIVQWHFAGEGVRTCQMRDLAGRQQVSELTRLRCLALEATVNSVVITDIKGTIKWVNPAFCEVSGYRPDEVIGGNPRILRSGRQSPEYYATMWRTILSGRTWHGEFVNRRKDGSAYTESVAVTPVPDSSGRPAYFIAIKQDISALRRSLTELELTQRQLQARNVELDAALVEARAAVQAKATFLATMSHEIRTPMNGVLGMAGLLRESSPLTSEQREYIDTIGSSGETLLTLINDILDFSKIESNRLELEAVPFDLRRCVEETLDSLGPRAREKRLELLADIDPAVPPAIVGDSVRLRQVLTNLVGNALKFTSAGEVVVELRATPQDGGKVLFSCAVRDTGIGIPAEKIDRLFKSFSQADSSTTRVYGGSGLGLAISQRLVQLMGGLIAVESEPGRGSRFFFDLLATPAPVVDPLQAGPLVTLTGRRVLLVEHNATARRILADHLRRADCVVAEVDGAASATAWLAANPWPDLIVTDLEMPGADGLEFAQQVRAVERGRPGEAAVPILAISSSGWRADDQRLQACGLAAVMAKPIRRLPFLEHAARVSGQAPARAVARDRGTAEGLAQTAAQHPRRILLAEDNLVNRRVMLSMLARMGYEATPVINGGLAVEAVMGQTFDLVLMDVQMPEMDGFEATRRIRGLNCPQPVIVAMTANVMSGDREACLAAGMDDYVSKPIDRAELYRVLTSAVRGGC